MNVGIVVLVVGETINRLIAFHLFQALLSKSKSRSVFLCHNIKLVRIKPELAALDCLANFRKIQYWKCIS